MDDGKSSRFCCGELKLVSVVDYALLYLFTRFLRLRRTIERKGATPANDTAAFHVTCSSPPILSAVFLLSHLSLPCYRRRLSSSGSPPPFLLLHLISVFPSLAPTFPAIPGTFVFVIASWSGSPGVYPVKSIQSKCRWKYPSGFNSRTCSILNNTY